ncbi:MAG TPA: helix-turn-helix domain-containing protein, partial [Chloroflexota bacterium]
MAITEDGELYTVAQAARRLGVHPSTIWRWIDAERLPAYRVGPKNIRIKASDLERMVQPAKPEAKQVTRIKDPYAVELPYVPR